jgi:hypothetical protein
MNRTLAILGAFALTALGCLADSRFTGFSDPRLSTPKMIRLLIPEVMDFIKNADSVSVFRADLTKKPSEAGYEANLRQINGQERDQLVSIFVDPANYYQGLYCIVEPPADFGIEFRNKDEKLVLLCGGLLLDGSFRDRRLRGVLATSGNHLFSQWCQKYAQPK